MRVFDVELHDNERVLFRVRQHWIFLLWPTWRLVLLIILGSIGALMLRPYVDGSILLFGFIVWILLSINWWIKDFFLWYLRLYVVTNQRIVNVSHKNIFKRQVTEASLHKVQDVTHQSLGVLSMLFNFGDVIVQTAGHQTLIHFRMVPRSQSIHKEITGLVMKYHHGLPPQEGKVHEL